MRTVLLFCLLFSSLTIHSQVYINEYLSSNVNGTLDEDQEFSDWLEIYNVGESAVDITGYGLSDDKLIPSKWTFPPLILPAQKHLLVFASGKDRKEVPMSFNTIIDMADEWHYFVPDSEIGSAWHGAGYVDTSWATGKSGFGYADDDDSTVVSGNPISMFIRKEFTVTDLSDLGRLILSIDYDDGFVAYINGHEVARSNLGNAGEYMAFNRLANTLHEAVMYSGGAPEYFEISNPAGILAEGTNILAIQVHNNVPGSSDLSLIPFLTVGRFTNGPDNISQYLTFSDFGGLHTNFKIDADSESVYLFNGQATLIDSTGSIGMFRDVSYGRESDGASGWCYFGFPTPGAPNSTPGSGPLAADSVVFSPEGGMHTSGVMVNFITSNTTDSIYYTIDGSIPDTGDLRYTGPVTVDTTIVIRARVIKSNFLPGPIASRTYVTEFDHDIPIICLSTEPSNLWDENYGIYAMGTAPPGDEPHFNANFWKDWERPVHFELFEVDGILRIDQEAGAKIFGAWSRASDQKSFSLFARKSYGKGSFKYKFFADKPIDKFESIVLRNSGNDNMGLQFHDCFMTGLTREMNIDRQAYQPAAIYINGQYWGLLNIREKINSNYIAENHLVDPDSINLLEGGGNVVEGSNTEYLAITNYLNTKSTLQNDADYTWVRDKVDIDNFIQYQLTQIYLNNRDWPGNNIKFWNTTTPGSKWRWILYDTDFGFGIWDVNDYKLNTLEFALEPSGPIWPNPPWATLLLRRMISNPGFRNNFIIQYCDRLNQDFHPSRVDGDLDSLKNLYDHEIVYNFNRWWSNYDEWMWKLNSRKIFGQNRPAYCRQHMRSKFNLGSELNVNIDVSDSRKGYVRLNTIYPKKFPFNGIYFKNIPITMEAIPKPGYRFVRWEGSVNSTQPIISYNMAASGIFNAVFTEAAVEDFSIVINEINYKSSPGHDTKDWVELLNNGSTSADISNWWLIDSGVDSGYVFQPGTILVPGSYLVICRDLNDFRSFNPNVQNGVGDLPFGLRDDGDIVRLFDANNRLRDAVNYGTTSPWPESLNSSGFTIELKDPGLDNSLGANWISVSEGGTPGKINSSLPVNIEGTVDGKGMSLECFPNPFRDYTTIRFDAVAAGKYRLEVMDIQGRLVKVLASENLDPGSYWIDWNGEGSISGGGVFTIRLISDTETLTSKVVKL